MKSAVTILAFLFFVSDAWATQGELWETRLVVHSVEHGRMEMPPQQMCQETIDLSTFRLENFMPGEARQCDVADTTQVGNKVTWSMECPEGRSEGSMRMVSHDLYQGEMSVRTSDGDYRMEFKGRRIGSPCELDAQD